LDGGLDTDVNQLDPEEMEDLVTKFGTIYGEEEIDAVAEVIRRGAPTNDEGVRAFENAFAHYCGVEHAIAVTSGTTALNLGCAAADIGPGDQVLVPSITWIATANAATLQGAEVVFVDVDPRTSNMDPVDLEAKMSERSKLIIPVHLYGQPCEMKSIEEVARKHDCPVMADCAHSPGAEYGGKKAGSLGDMGAFSFHQQKNMSTLGEGGMLTTDDEDLYRRARMFQNHGREGHSHVFTMVGHNYRMTDVQAVAGLIQLSKLDELNSMRIRNAKLLTTLIEGIPGITPPYIAGNVKHVFHLYNVLVEKEFGMERDELISGLGDRGITAGTHYEPIHLADIYRRRGSRPGDCPVAEDIGLRNVTLPMHPRLTEGSIRYMADALGALDAG
jgi:perosamine synthetase